MRRLVIVMAHGDAKDTFNRHLPFWQDLGGEMLVVCPSDQPVRVEGIPSLHIGSAQHHGRDAIRRFRYVMEHVSQLGYDQICFFEYDSICLGKLPELHHYDMGANVFHDASGEFKGTIFCHPPMIFWSQPLQKVVQEFQSIPSTDEGGFWDRWIGLAIERAGVNYMGFLERGLGYSHNTIHKEQHKDLFKAIVNGARMLHGIKDVETLDVVRRAWRKREAIDIATTPDELELE